MNQAEIFRRRQAARRRELLQGEPAHRVHWHVWSGAKTYLKHKWYVRDEVTRGRVKKMYQLLRAKGLPTDLIREITDRVLDAEFDEKFWDPHRGSYGEIL